MNATAIHKILSTAWPDDSPNLRRIQKIVQELRDGDRQTFERAAGSGRRVSDTRNDNIRLAEEAVEDDNDLSVKELATRLGISDSMVYRIITEDLEKK